MNAVLTLPPTSTSRNLRGSLPVRRDQRPPGTCSTDTHPAIRLNTGSFDLFATHSRSNRLQQTLDPHVITQQVHIRTYRCTTWQTARLRQLCFFEPVSSSLSSRRTCSTMEVTCDGADDDDDPPCATGADTVCDVETAGETGTVVCSANLTFVMFGSASETERDIIACASLTRAMRSTSEDMALMIRVLHCSAWSREGTRQDHCCFTVPDVFPT